jgi:hypothetical protein
MVTPDCLFAPLGRRLVFEGTNPLAKIVLNSRTSPVLRYLELRRLRLENSPFMIRIKGETANHQKSLLLSAILSRRCGS